MKFLVPRAFLAIFSFAALYGISSCSARASDWGCQVLLCLSNPGGPTEYAECAPPIHKLWRELAKGHPFPTCSGAGIKASRPRYEPFYCDAGYNLTTHDDAGGREAACVSETLKPVPGSQCSSRDAASSVSARWTRGGGVLQCKGYITMRPNIRPRPHYFDVTIDGVGSQRVWF